MSRRKGRIFEMIEGEGILRVRNKNQAKTGKNWNLRQKRKEWAIRKQNGVGEGNGKIWDFKYQNNEDLEIKLSIATTTTLSTTNWKDW